MSESGSSDACPDDDDVSVVAGGLRSAFSMTGALHAFVPDPRGGAAVLLVFPEHTAENDEPQQGGEDPPQDTLIHHFGMQKEQLDRERSNAVNGFSLPISFPSH